MTNNSVSPPTTYRHVAILRPGTFTDATGLCVRFTPEDLQAVADNYDPAYHTAALNLDHAESGPAHGFISDLVWDGTYLRADLAGVPPELAQQLAAGRYPYRSAEVYADLDGRGPYLRALALLGARPPAVKGLPPLPQAQPAAQHSGADAAGPCAAPASRMPRILTIFMEAPMPRIAPPPAQAAPAPDPAVHPASQAGVSAPAAPASQETIRLAEEHQRLVEDAVRLAEENRELKALKRQRDVRFFMAELRGSGRLTPALERAGVEHVLLLAEEQPLALALPDGRQVSLSTVLRELLRALPVSFSLGEAVAAATPARPHFSPDDEAVMAALGLSAEEYVKS